MSVSALYRVRAHARTHARTPVLHGKMTNGIEFLFFYKHSPTPSTATAVCRYRIEFSPRPTPLHTISSPYCCLKQSRSLLLSLVSIPTVRVRRLSDGINGQDKTICASEMPKFLSGYIFTSCSRKSPTTDLMIPYGRSYRMSTINRPLLSRLSSVETL